MDGEAASAGLRDGRARSFAWTLFALALGGAMLVHNDRQPPLAWALFACAALLACAATLLPLARLLPQRAAEDEELLLSVGLLSLLLQTWALSTANVSWSLKPDSPALRILALGAIASGMLAALGLVQRTPLGRARLPLLLAAHAAVGLYVVAITPDPWIDVHLFHANAVKALLAGRSPYGQLTTNLYQGLPFYSAAVLTPDGAQVKVGFPYPPLQLLLALPFQALLGDYRYLQALALTGSGLLLALARPGRLSALAAGLFLVTPRLFFTLEGSWTEPLVVLFLSLVLFCAVRAPRLLPWALGGLFAIKQYTVLLAPLVPFLLPVEGRTVRAALRLTGQALLVAGLLALPFFLWSPRGFLDDVLLFQARQPFRIDSLSLNALLARASGRRLSDLASFAGLLAVLLLGHARSRRDAYAFAAFGCLGFLVFFALAKQAFANYYLFVLGLGCWALALSGARNDASSAAAAHEVTQGA